ncbi:hypothetical protein [Marinicella litoralis]|uniref:Uncharacterized protein n=1 Tax=Marinicella litoralis TaxID=644220 RepID=A0A4R6XR59_9GAMM|nr:hypothetical protein [Marinicella litoralis]TDR20474.1 hypothetical protein C8D91_1448 [Marinicella litoralis]
MHKCTYNKLFDKEMNHDALKILEDAISDVGYWRYWFSEKEMFQIEFGGTQLHNSPQEENSPPSGILALRFVKPSSVVAIVRGEEEDFEWFDKLSKDEIEPFTVSYEEFTLTDSSLAQEIIQGAKKKKEISCSNEQLPKKGGFYLAFWSGDVGMAIHAEHVQALSHDGELSPELIKEKNSKWWTYWREYWDRRDTDAAMPQDYACEVTIPAGTEINIEQGSGGNG